MPFFLISVPHREGEHLEEEVTSATKSLQDEVIPADPGIFEFSCTPVLIYQLYVRCRPGEIHGTNAYL